LTAFSFGLKWLRIPFTGHLEAIMNEQIRQIADRIRGLRDIAQLSLETCAQDLGIPADTYRRYESGEADIPASFLYQVAGKFHVELSSLLTGEEPRLRVYSVTRAGRGVKVAQIGRAHV
jgi:transcriptional regulator with XRE-family HTH domain